MPAVSIYILWGLTLLLSIGAFVAVFVLYKQSRKKVSPAVSQEELSQLEEMKAKGREILLEARDEALRIKREAESEAQKRRAEVSKLESRVSQKEEWIDKRIGASEEREKSLSLREKAQAESEKKIEEIKREQLEKLQRVSGLTKEEAKNIILTAVEKNLKSDIARRIKETEEEIKFEADRKAKEILVTAIQKVSTEYVAEYTTSTIALPDDEMKGRIIGREGRNIRTFENLAGVNVEIDETPGVITLSSFDGVRREVARRAMEKLIADGRIQPARIEEVVAKSQRDVDKIIREAGEQLVYETGVTGLPSEIIDLLGRFKFRTSYGQNMIAHTLEVVNIGKVLANEIGTDVKIVKAACLLHDIGKVLTADTEGSHTQIGADILRRHKISERIIQAMESHHEEKPFTSIEGILVNVADAISGARPGARYEDYESYVKRISELENIAASFDGVEKTFALQAGREVRVIVIPQKVDDNGIVTLAHGIAKRIHDEVVYPGMVKVTVVRENRAVEVAK
ncbi:ribonuclease Y, partial [bacterium CG1_02_42_9]